MQIATLEILEEAQFPAAQVRALAKVFETIEDNWRSDLVTVPILDARLAELKGELRTEMHGTAGELKAAIQSAKSETSRWILLAIMGQAPVYFGMMYFLLDHMR